MATANHHSADATILTDLLQAELARNDASDWTVNTFETWCQVTPAGRLPRPHGWKLHVAATPLSAPLVLARVAAVLITQRCGFKFARDLRRVAQLVDGRCERSAGGKFLTAYPGDDEQFRRLAYTLHAATADLAGPRILSDKPLRPSSVVHYRYGEFHGEPVFTDEGVFDSHLYDPEGQRFTDERRAWFSPPVWAPAAFTEEPDLLPGSVPDSVLLNGRFRVTRALRQANKGGVYRAVDEFTGSEVVIKQARAHVGARLNGTDARDLLRREAAMLERLRPLDLVPAKVAFFEQQGDLFLAEELIAGEPAHLWASRHREQAATLVRPLISLVRRVHDAGYVLCDLKPHNVMVGPDHGLRLIDVEHVVRTGHECLAATEGFAAPEIASASTSASASASASSGMAGWLKAPLALPAIDCYSLGATIFHLLTGLDGRWLGGPPRVLEAIAAAHPQLSGHIELVSGLTRPDPGTRWTLATATAARGHRKSAASRRRSPASALTLLHDPALDRYLDKEIVELRERMTPQGRYLWRRSRAHTKHTDPCAAWPGAAGVLATLTRFAPSAASDRHLETIRQAAAWIDARLDSSVPRLLPGLGSGRAGTAWALYDAAELLADQRLRDRAVGLAKALPIHAPCFDVSNGRAGAGLLHLYLWQHTVDKALRQRALNYAQSILDRPEPAARSGTLLGFSHGLAGAGAFLISAAAVADGDDAQRFTHAAQAIGGTVAGLAHVVHGRATWPLDLDHNRGRETFWCNGPSGIGEFLLRLGTLTGDGRHLELAEQAAETVVADPWRHPVGACCGLAGAGQFLLDLAQHTGNLRYRRYAHHIAAAILAQRAEPRGRGDDYAHGTAGVLDFLTRIRQETTRPWMPAPHRLAAADPTPEGR